LATMEWIPPPKPRRDKDALYQVAGPAAHGTGLRPTGRRTPGPHRRPERLHRARNTRHGSCGISPSGERGTSALGHVDKWRSQRRIDVMSMKPRKLSAVLS